jgi:hypothetical protein
LRQAAAGLRFDAIMRNSLRGDPIALEAWKSARRLPRVMRGKKQEVSTTAEPPIEPDPQPQAEPQPA